MTRGVATFKSLALGNYQISRRPGSAYWKEDKVERPVIDGKAFECLHYFLLVGRRLT